MNVSSVGIITRMFAFGTYAATKSFNHTFSHVMQKEVGNLLDILTVCPGPTLSNIVKTKAAPIVITADEHAIATISKLGHESETFGHWKHTFVPKIVYSLPNFIINPYEPKVRKVFLTQKEE